MTFLARHGSVFAFKREPCRVVIKGLAVKPYERKIPSVVFLVALGALPLRIFRMKPGSGVDAFAEFRMAGKAVLI
jgi:hypothetical protein